MFGSNSGSESAGGGGGGSPYARGGAAGGGGGGVGGLAIDPAALGPMMGYPMAKEQLEYVYKNEKGPFSGDHMLMNVGGCYFTGTLFPAKNGPARCLFSRAFQRASAARRIAQRAPRDDFSRENGARARFRAVFRGPCGGGDRVWVGWGRKMAGNGAWSPPGSAVLDALPRRFSELGMLTTALRPPSPPRDRVDS